MTSRAAFFVLFGRRQQSSRWILVSAAVLLFVLALAGLRHGAFTWYTLLATSCLLQVLYPTFAGWCLVLVLFLSAALSYSFLVIGEVTRIWTGSEPPKAFLGPREDGVYSSAVRYGRLCRNPSNVCPPAAASDAECRLTPTQHPVACVPVCLLAQVGVSKWRLTWRSTGRPGTCLLSGEWRWPSAG